MEKPPQCQIYCVISMADGLATDVHRSPYMNFRVWLARTLGPARKRAIKKRIAAGLDLVSRLTGRRKRAEPFNDYKGLAIMPGMWQYCGTEQRVLKPVMRYVDERELRMRKASGIVLLEGVMCQGTDIYPCDRSCFYFWREEWLKKLD